MRRLPHIPSIFLVALLLVACDGPDADPVGLDAVDPVTTVARSASADVQGFFVPAGGTFYNPCTDEWVGFDEGAGFRFVQRTVETPNGIHLGFHENGVALRGPGLENDGGAPGEPTGTQYHGMLAINESLNINGAAYPLTYTFTLRIVVDGSGGLPTWIRTERFHGTINGRGETAVVTSEPFASECRA